MHVVPSNDTERLIKLEKMVHTSNMYHASNKRQQNTIMGDIKNIITQLSKLTSATTEDVKIPILSYDELVVLENFSKTPQGKAAVRKRFEREHFATLYDFCRNYTEQLFAKSNYTTWTGHSAHNAHTSVQPQKASDMCVVQILLDVAQEKYASDRKTATSTFARALKNLNETEKARKKRNERTEDMGM
ncbi:uncharacterized protein LOC131688842 isoform X2 [Topomyia yanbarensis]|uniref:uncharacterized protein LOC131688842 isoform X2 n=1 Tax=Topomyia yanbarensis TaxID=2498891 RepID=UPI00273A770A|nr:uncharacterized protein LOC131688842 isoform X2 [Topomyia yanbarensis]